MAPLPELRLFQNVFVPSVHGTGVVVEIDAARRRVKVDYTPRLPHRRGADKGGDLRTGWFSPADLKVFHWRPHH